MANVVKAVVFNGKARVTVMDTTDIVNSLIDIHKLCPIAADALGRAVTIGCYIVGNFKSNKDRLNLIIDGGGELGKIYVSGKDMTIKGFVENPCFDTADGLEKAVGHDGFLTVIKDLGLKEPYIGKCQMVSGQLADDFANYLLKSEGIKNAVALGVSCNKDGCVKAGGIVIEALPGATEEEIFVLEDIMSFLRHFSSVLQQKSAKEIIEFYFGHFDCQIFEPQEISLHCDCQKKIYRTIKALGAKECYDILDKEGGIFIKCDYCQTEYAYRQKQLDFMFGGRNG